MEPIQDIRQDEIDEIKDIMDDTIKNAPQGLRTLGKGKLTTTMRTHDGITEIVSDHTVNLPGDHICLFKADIEGVINNLKTRSQGTLISAVAIVSVNLIYENRIIKRWYGILG